MMKSLKRKLGRPLVLAGLAASVALALGPNAQADFFVRTARIDTSTGGATTTGDITTDGGVNVVNGNSSAGNQFLNNLGSNMFGSPGSTVTVGSNLLASYSFQDGSTMGAVYNPATSPMQPIVAIFALAGSTTGGLSSTVFTATSGRVGLFSIAGTLVTNGYNKFNPLTWGATDATGTMLLTPIAVWDIKPPEFVFDNGPDPNGPPYDNGFGGGPGIFTLAPSQVNQISVNSAVGSANQGFFLFRETVDPVFASRGALSGNGYVDVIGNPPIVPPGFIFQDEGLVSRVDESIIANPTTGAIKGGPGTPGFDALNTIAAVLGGLPDLDLLMPGVQAFANGFGGVSNSGGDPRNFNPSNGTNLPFPDTADLYLTLGTTSSPGIQAVVPEPASVTMLLCGGLAAAGVAGIRRFRVK